MDIISLGPVERNRFAAWLEQQAYSNDEIIKPLGALPHTTGLVRGMRAEALAMLMIAKKLRSIEDMTIGDVEG